VPLPAPERPAPVAPPAVATASTPPTVGAATLALLEQARREAADGAPERAVATLERAVRIEPSNPWLWHRLAVLRLQQREWELAKGLAEKSNTLARGNPRLLGGNWRVIADAHAGLGDAAGSATARARSAEYFKAAAQP
jgi:Flp pilus assembly protein TadD